MWVCGMYVYLGVWEVMCEYEWCVWVWVYMCEYVWCVRVGVCGPCVFGVCGVGQ